MSTRLLWQGRSLSWQANSSATHSRTNHVSDPHSPARLGLLAPLTGVVGLYGQEIATIGRIARDEVNAAGGLLGRPLELVVIDDGSLPESAVPAAEHLAEAHGCTALIGNLLSNSRIAVASRVAEPRRIPLLNFSFYEGSIFGRYFFNFAALPNQQIERMIPYFAERFGPKMFFAGSNYEWPLGSIDAAKRSLKALGGEVVGEQYLPLGSDDTNDLLDRVARSGADVFVPYFAGSEQVQLLTRFAEMGLKSRMAVVMGHYDENLAGHLAPKVRAGLYSTNTYFMPVDTPENHQVLARLAEQPGVSGLWPRGNATMTDFSEGVCLSVRAFAAAVERAGSTDREAVVDALEEISVRSTQPPGAGHHGPRDPPRDREHLPRQLRGRRWLLDYRGVRAHPPRDT